MSLLQKFLFPVAFECPTGDWFESYSRAVCYVSETIRYDCVPGTQFESSQVHHALPFEPSVPEIRQLARQSAGLVRAFGLRNTAIGFGRPFRPCCLWDPQTRSWRGHRDRHQTARSTDETEHRRLAGPLDGRIAQAGDADAVWQSTFDSSLHKIRCKKSERYGHVDLAYAALLALSDAFHVRVCIRHKLVEPTASRAIDAIKVARVSDRIGRAWCGGSEIGRSISRRRVTAVLRHGTSRVSAPCARRRPDFSIWASWTINRSFDALNVVGDKALIVNRLRWLEVLPNRSSHQPLDVDCRDPAYRSGALRLALEQGG